MMKTCSFHPDAGLQGLRHTFLTDAGRYTKNVKALQRLAGHCRIQTTIRYGHPDESDMLEIVSAVQQSRSKQSGVATVFTTVETQETQAQRKM